MKDVLIVNTQTSLMRKCDPKMLRTHSESNGHCCLPSVNIANIVRVRHKWESTTSTTPTTPSFECKLVPRDEHGSIQRSAPTNYVVGCGQVKNRIIDQQCHTNSLNPSISWQQLSLSCSTSSSFRNGRFKFAALLLTKLIGTMRTNIYHLPENNLGRNSTIASKIHTRELICVYGSAHESDLSEMSINHGPYTCARTDRKFLNAESQVNSICTRVAALVCIQTDCRTCCAADFASPNASVKFDSVHAVSISVDHTEPNDRTADSILPLTGPIL